MNRRINSFPGFHLIRDSRYHTHPKFLPFPSKHVSIRKCPILTTVTLRIVVICLLGGAREETYMVVEIRDTATQQSTHVLEDIEFSRALFELYEGGVVWFLSF